MVPRYLTILCALCAFGAQAQAASDVPVVAKSRVRVHPQSVVLSPLSAEQLELADKVLLGRIDCEAASSVTVSRDLQQPGWFVLELNHQRFVMAPVATSTGAVRLEDAKTGAVWIQVANRSMLVNQKLGRRLVGGCMTAEQAQVAQALERGQGVGPLDAPAAAPAPMAGIVAVAHTTK